MINTPDRWVIVDISTPEYGTIRKVLASWIGGYTTGDSWKLSSPVLRIEPKGELFVVHTESGSRYNCYKDTQGTSLVTQSIYNLLSEQAEIREVLLK